MISKFKRPTRIRVATSGTRKARAFNKRNQVSSNTKKIRMLTNAIEYKFFETVTNKSPQNDEILETSLVIIPQNDTPTGRDGRKIVVTGIHFKGYLKLGTGSGGDAIRIVLYVDKQPNGAVATTASYWSRADDNGNSFRNLTSVKRYRVLMDKTYVVNPGASSVVSPLRRLEWNFKVNIPINYTSTVGAITELLETNIGLMSSCKGADFDLDGTWRIRYMDL